MHEVEIGSVHILISVRSLWKALAIEMATDGDVTDWSGQNEYNCAMKPPTYS